MKIGFIGLGIMGKPMAKNLIKSGHQLVVANRSQTAVQELVKLGAEAAKTPAEVARKSNVLITMLPNSPEVKDVALGRNGLIEGATAGSVLIDMSSIAPLASQEIAAELAKKRIDMLDAPVSGGEPKAIEGTIAVMVGGKKQVFDANYDILMAMAGSVVYVGEIGAGNTAKLCNQIVVALNIAAVSEALVLAQKAGVSPELVYKAIRGGLAGSTVLDAKAPMMMERNFAPGFRIDLHIKDMNNVMETAHKVGAPLPLAAQVVEIMQAVKQDGCGVDDHSSIVKFYEKIANVEVTK
ncbi:2-hydroxy-3-oxopropionate reductase [candidate division KSB1 bacterium]|nr:2-hydroxy-3-oxopropionate reductase [candidate division KSB1 bacterium]